MRKKRNNGLNVSQLFALKYSSGPKLFQKTPRGTFSQAVVGFKLGTDGYRNSWPELKSQNSGVQSHSSTNDRISPSSSSSGGCYDLGDSNQSQCTERQRINVHLSFNCNNARNNNSLERTSDIEADLTHNNSHLRSSSFSSQLNPEAANFPSLNGDISNRKVRRLTKHPADNKAGQANQTPVLGHVNTPRTDFVKPKKNDPININIESAIEMCLSRKKKKELKRLVKKSRPVQVNCGNALDSANPVRKRGKVREGKRKVTTLRKTIERLRNLDNTERDQQSSLCKQLNGLSLTEKHLEILAKAKIHTSKFRQYCTNLSSKELVSSVKELLLTLRGFQDRMHDRDEIKAKARRRFVIGFHETMKLLKSGSLRLIIMATNIEKNPALLDKINEFIQVSAKEGVTVIFAGLCHDLAYWLFKKNRTCIVGIINYDGAKDIHDKMMSFYARDKAEYEDKLSAIIESEKNMMSTDELEESLRTNMLDKLRTD